MVNVIAWPPVVISSWEFTRLDPVGRSQSVFTGRRRVSSALRSRRLAAASVPGLGMDHAGAGYIEMLKEFLLGGVNLVRVDCIAPIWHQANCGLDRSNAYLDWSEGSTPLEWESGAVPLVWGGGTLELLGVPEMDGTWNAVRVTGFPPNMIVARPSELVTITDGSTVQSAKVLKVAWSDASGIAVIRLNAELTLSGLVGIGEPESVVFEAIDMPRAVQTPQGDWAYTWGFIEVFEDETEGFVEVDPWR